MLIPKYLITLKVCHKIHCHITYLSRLKNRYIILSVDGPDENVLKFKPPMCFSRMDAEFLLTNLNEVLSEVEATMRREHEAFQG